MSKPKVMVALRDDVSVESLMALACQLSQGADVDLLALHVVQVPMVTPLDAEDENIDRDGKLILEHARKAAGKFPFSISTELLRAREVGEAIVGVARERGVGLIVMGHHKPHSRALGETFGEAIAHYVARHATCRVILQIPAPAHNT